MKSFVVFLLETDTSETHDFKVLFVVCRYWIGCMEISIEKRVFAFRFVDFERVIFVFFVWISIATTELHIRATHSISLAIYFNFFVFWGGLDLIASISNDCTMGFHWISIVYFACICHVCQRVLLGTPDDKVNANTYLPVFYDFFSYILFVFSKTRYGELKNAKN